MNSREIINKLASDKVIEDIIQNIAKTSIDKDDTLKDLAQMLYLDLLQKDSVKIEQLYESGQLQFFITRMVINNLESKNSPYYYQYKKFSLLSNPIDNLNDEEEPEH